MKKEVKKTTTVNLKTILKYKAMEKKKKEDFNVGKAVTAQNEYQKRTGSPAFPPSSGVCWVCRKNIYVPYEYKGANGETYLVGITVKEAGERLITGCPHCNRSYCD